MIRINLAPADVGRRRRGVQLSLPSFNLGLLFGVLYLAAVVGVGWYWWGRSGQRDHLTGEVARAQTELTAAKVQLGQSDKLRSDLADMRKRVEVIEGLTRNQARPTLLVDAFADMLPPELWITSLEEKDSVLKVSGTALSSASVADFMGNLRRSGKFKDVDVVVSRQDPTKTPRLVTFEVTCRFES